jgi:hypothetical protein
MQLDLDHGQAKWSMRYLHRLACFVAWPMTTPHRVPLLTQRRQYRHQFMVRTTHTTLGSAELVLG